MTRSKINLLQMINSSDWGGGEAHVLSLVQFFHGAGFRVYATFPRHGPLVESVKRCCTRAFVLDWRGLNFPLAAAKLFRLLKKYNIHVVHSHDTRTNLLGRIAGKAAGVQAVVATYHIAVSNITDMGPLRKAILLASDRLTFPLCDGAVAVSYAVLHRLMADGYPMHPRVRVIHNGIDPSWFSPINPPAQTLSWLGIPSGAPVVGTVARLSHEKSQGTLIRVMLKIKRTFPDARCVIVGSGPMENPLKKLAAEMGLSRECIFIGHSAEVPALLSAMDVFVLPSTVEGFPTSVLEAMGMAKAVVAFRVGGLPEMVEHGKTGILIEPGNEGRMAEAIISLLHNDDDRRRMGMAGRARVKEHFCLKNTMVEIKGFYFELLARKPSLLKLQP